MRNIMVLLGLISASSFAVSGNELVENANPEYPTKSISHLNSQVQVKRYVIADNTDETIASVSQKVVRNVGSDHSKKIRIIWANKSTEKLAKNVKEKLVSLNIETKQISLERSKVKKDVYPLYIEIQYVSPKRAKCKVDTAEDMMTFDPYVPCASKSNSQVQLKTK
ncbi:hypothetical protein A1D29_10750 [Pasteurellaceae bacterium Orientalotternb1]|nr:hypothetical protein A1D29_10750 [Pasteurellaceae bacterium Orientalotternb1]